MCFKRSVLKYITNSTWPMNHKSNAIYLFENLNYV